MEARSSASSPEWSIHPVRSGVCAIDQVLRTSLAQIRGDIAEAGQAFLLDEETTPSADCCASVSNVSSGLPACFCKVTFYPPSIVNSTQQKRMPGLCNVDTQLCQTCPQYMVPRENNLPDWTDPYPSAGSSAHLASKVAEYRTTMTWLAVVLALTLAAIIASAAFFMHRRWKAKKKSTAALASKMSDSSTIPPGSDF